MRQDRFKLRLGNVVPDQPLDDILHPFVQLRELILAHLVESNALRHTHHLRKISFVWKPCVRCSGNNAQAAEINEWYFCRNG